MTLKEICLGSKFGINASKQDYLSDMFDSLHCHYLNLAFSWKMFLDIFFRSVFLWQRISKICIFQGKVFNFSEQAGCLKHIHNIVWDCLSSGKPWKGLKKDPLTCNCIIHFASANMEFIRCMWAVPSAKKSWSRCLHWAWNLQPVSKCHVLTALSSSQISFVEKWRRKGEGGGETYKWFQKAEHTWVSFILSMSLNICEGSSFDSPSFLSSSGSTVSFCLKAWFGSSDHDVLGTSRFLAFEGAIWRSAHNNSCFFSFELKK